MLQIISGKFFKNDERYRHDGKGILYSNYSSIIPIHTSVATLEPVDRFKDVSSYVLVYINQLEKQDAVVRTGDAEILEQFQLLSTFGLQAYFSPFREEVAQICRQNSRGGTDLFIPSQFIPRFFNPGLTGKQEEITKFIELIEKVIGLERKKYQAVISALKTIRDCLLAANYNLDLSYSLLVYCLEALSQEFDSYLPVWEDFNEHQRQSLEKIFHAIDVEQSNAIRAILVDSANLRLRQRFLKFTTNHISIAFYTEEANGIKSALRRSQTERALNNAYIFRSKYVHQLSPIIHQLHIPQIAIGDTFLWNNEPYLTLSGLLRLTIHVIKNFINRSAIVMKEDYDWQNALPGVVKLKLAPQYWIWRAETFQPSEATNRFSGLLEQMHSSIVEKGSITDLRELMDVIKKKIAQGRPSEKVTMAAMYWLYNEIIPVEYRHLNWQKFVELNKQLVDICSIETMLTRLMLFQDFPWSVDECVNIYKQFNKARFRQVSIEIPALFEAALLVRLANQALQEKQFDIRQWLLEMALDEMAGRLDLQTLLKEMLDKHEDVDIVKILGVNAA